MDSTWGRQHVSSVEPFSREMIGSGEIVNKPADKCPIFWAPKHSHWKGLDTVCRPRVSNFLCVCQGYCHSNTGSDCQRMPLLLGGDKVFKMVCTTDCPTLDVSAAVDLHI